MAKSKAPRKKRNTGVPLGATPVDMETFIAGIDNAYNSGEFDEEIAEEHQELQQTLDEKGTPKVDTLYDVLIDVFQKAADDWAKKSAVTGFPSKFFISIKPVPKQEGEYAAIICMALHYSCMGRGKLICEKFYGCRTFEDFKKDDWKAVLVQSMITELFGISALFLQAKEGISSSDIMKVQIQKGAKKAKAKK